MQPRIEKIIQLMDRAGLDGIALNPGPTLAYLTGLQFHLMERPTVLLVTARGDLGLVLPALEAGKLAGLPGEYQAFTYSDDPQTRSKAFQQAADHLDLSGDELGVEATRMRYLELMYLGDAFPDVGFVDASDCLAELRLVKDSDEIARMRKAAQIAETAIVSTLQSLRAGVTESAMANELIIQLLRAGSDPGLPFSPIVAFGENTANPHALPSDRPLQPGDLVLFDWGAACGGYLSDITRTFSFGEVDPEMLRVGEIVLCANRAGREAVRPGVAAGTVDRAARAVIEDAGYGTAFIHRTGHGLGLEAHEDPYIFDGNERVMTAGMTFTVEPGIYLTGQGGVRIEDDVVVTESGVEALTTFPRHVQPIENFFLT